MDPEEEFVRRIRPVVLNPQESLLFWACYTEDIGLAIQIRNKHPTLTIYTISCWDRENWVHRGARSVNRLGYLFGAEDLGEDFAQLLWEDDELLD